MKPSTNYKLNSAKKTTKYNLQINKKSQITNNGYTFGLTRYKRGVLRVIQGRLKKYNCTARWKLRLYIDHVFTECRITKVVTKNLSRTDLQMEPIKNEMILHKLNADSMKLTLMSIYKRKVLKYKQHLDIAKVTKENEWKKNITKISWWNWCGDLNKPAQNKSK